MISNHYKLRWQWDWVGAELINKRILVSEDELDIPQRQLGVIELPPDPLPIINARPEQYYIDEQTFRVQMNGVQRYLMDGVTPRLQSNLQNTIQLVDDTDTFVLYSEDGKQLIHD
jgi:hypothetical protein